MTMEKRPPTPALTPARRNARMKAVRIRRRVLLGVIILVAAFVSLVFARLGYTRMELERTEQAVREKHELLQQKKKTYRENIKNFSSLEGQKDQMRETGRFEDDEVPFVILEPEEHTQQGAGK
jgi:tellurite resistance protein